MGRQIEDLTGKRFGQLEVLEKSISDKRNGNTRWYCKCDCGNFCIADKQQLKTGRTKSCGCYRRKRLGKENRKYNTYDLYNEFCVGYDDSGKEFYFDISDYYKIKDFYWYVDSCGRVSTATNGKNIRLHKVITDTTSEIIDHADHNPSNNQRCNLRISDKQTNGINRPCNKNNRLGVKGVSLTSNSKKYIARIMVNGRTIHLGCFDNIDDAKKARQEAEKKYFGEFAYKGD